MSYPPHSTNPFYPLSVNSTADSVIDTESKLCSVNSNVKCSDHRVTNTYLDDEISTENTPNKKEEKIINYLDKKMNEKQKQNLKNMEDVSFTHELAMQLYDDDFSSDDDLPKENIKKKQKKTNITHFPQFKNFKKNNINYSTLFNKPHVQRMRPGLRNENLDNSYTVMAVQAEPVPERRPLNLFTIRVVPSGDRTTINFKTASVLSAYSDSGAEINIIGEDLVPPNMRIVKLPRSVMVYSPLDTSFKREATHEVHMTVLHTKIPNFWIETKALVLSNCKVFILTEYDSKRLGHDNDSHFHNPIHPGEYITAEGYGRKRLCHLKVIESADQDLDVLKDVIDLNVNNPDVVVPSKLGVYDFRLEDDAPERFPGRMYSINERYHDQIEAQIRSLCDDGVIVKLPKHTCVSSHLPILAVKKKTIMNSEGKIIDQVRLCIDPTEINKFIKKPETEMSMNIEEILREAIKHKYFTVLDIKAAFNSCRISERVSEAMTFRFQGEYYRYKRGPFGLSDFPHYFNSIMTQVLTGLDDICRFYVDDIVIYSDTWEEHVEHIKSVLGRLTENNLHISADKCQWGVTQAKLLGWKITPDGIMADDEKIESIMRLRLPKTKKELLGFIGQCGFIRKAFYADWAGYQAALNEVISYSATEGKGNKMIWTNKGRLAFDFAKLRLKESIVTLHNMPPDAQRVIYCDASDFAWGAAVGYMMMNDDGVMSFVPVDIAQGVFSGYESRYLSVKKELLSIVRSIQRFDGLLGGRPFIVYSDCKSLERLHIPRTIDRTMASWLGQLLPYDFQVKWCEGTVGNWLVDALSRDYREKIDVGSISNNVRVVELNDKGNPKYMVAMTAVETVLNPDDGSEHTSLIEERLGLTIYKYANDSTDIDLDERITPDDEEKEVLLQWAHDRVGHASKEYMVNWLLDHKIAWRGMHADAKRICDNCIHCLEHNFGRKRHLMARGFNASAPLQCVQVDLHGPMARTYDGNEHILAMVDVATGFAFLEPVPDTKSTTITPIMRKWFSYFGHPKIIHSDNGSSFSSKHFADLVREVNAEWKTGAAYKPEHQGIVERLNGSMGTLIRKLESSMGIQWDLLLPRVQTILNTRIDPITKRDSFQLMFGRNEIEFKDYTGSENKFDVEAWTRHIDVMMKAFLNSSLDQKKVVRKKANEKLNKSRAQGTPLAVGTPVLLHVNRTNKDQPYWEGIFVVSRVDSKGAHFVKNSLGRELKRKFALDQLKVAGSEVAKLNSVERIVDMKSPKSPDEGVSAVINGEEVVFFEDIFRVLWKGEKDSFNDDWYTLAQLSATGYNGHVQEYLNARKLTRGYDPIYKLKTKEEYERRHNKS